MYIKTRYLGASVKNRLRTPRLVIIEFTLAGLPTRGGPGQLLELSLAANYMPNPKDLHYEQIVFDIKDDDAFEVHADLVTSTVTRLQAM